MRNLAQLAVVAVTVVSLTIVAAVGVSASSGKLGNPHATTVSVLAGHSDLGFLNDAFRLISANRQDNNREDNKDGSGRCHPPKKHHKNGTPGHKNHPCGEDDETD